MTEAGPHAPDAPGEESKPASHAEGNRRRFERTPCRVPANISIIGEDVSLPGTVTDISPGGCYVEMLAPLPIGTRVEVTLISENNNFVSAGSVRSAQEGMGMGVGFDNLNAEQMQGLKKIVPEIPFFPAPAPGTAPAPAPKAIPAASPAASPAADSSPHSHPASAAEVLEAVVRVLLRKGVMTRSELAEELEKAKSGKH